MEPNSSQEAPMAESMVSDLLDEPEVSTSKLRDFHIEEILKLIEDTINAEEYRIEVLISKIHNACKGTKAEPFLENLKKYLEKKYHPGQTIHKLFKKFGDLFWPKPAENEKKNEAPQVPIQGPIINPEPVVVPQPQPYGFDMPDDYSNMPNPVEAMQGFMRNLQGPDHEFGHHMPSFWGRSRGRGGFMRQMMHSYHDRPMRDRSESSSSGSDEEEPSEHDPHKRRKHHKKGRKFPAEELAKQMVVVSDHSLTMTAKPGEAVPVTLILQNQSSRVTPKHTCISKTDQSNEIGFDLLKIGEKLRRNEQKEVTMTLTMPDKPGEYKCKFRFTISRKKEIGTPFELSFLVFEEQ